MKGYLLLVMALAILSFSSCNDADEANVLAAGGDASLNLPFRGNLGLHFDELGDIEGHDGIMTMSWPPSHAIFQRSWQGLQGTLIYYFDHEGLVREIQFVVSATLEQVNAILAGLYQAIPANQRPAGYQYAYRYQQFMVGIVSEGAEVVISYSLR